jgi:hypothetical protein
VRSSEKLSFLSMDSAEYLLQRRAGRAGASEFSSDRYGKPDNLGCPCRPDIYAVAMAPLAIHTGP